MALYLKDLAVESIAKGKQLIKGFLHRPLLEFVADGVDKDGQLWHHGVPGQKWGIRRGPPYPLGSSDDSESARDKDREKKIPKRPVVIPSAKLLEYALDPIKSKGKSKAFELALGYTKKNWQDLVQNIQRNLNIDKFIEKGDNGFGMRYEYVMRLQGPNGKTANVLTAWIDDGKELRLTSVYVVKREETT